jgi:acyl carrier protein
MDNKSKQIVDIISTVLKSEVNRDTVRADCVKWDSLKHIEIIFAIEDFFAVEFTEDEMIKLDSVQAFVDRIENAT